MHIGDAIVNDSFFLAFVTYVTVLIDALHLSLQKKSIMEQLHAHEVLHMMEGNSYTEATLRAAIVEKFGEHQRFYACSADNMEVDELIEFLKRKGKFMPAGEEFTVDISKVCSH